jgi:hypothetical protein
MKSSAEKRGVRSSVDWVPWNARWSFRAGGFALAHDTLSLSQILPPLQGAKRRRARRSSKSEGGSNPVLLAALDRFAEPVIGRALARPGGSQHSPDDAGQILFLKSVICLIRSAAANCNSHGRMFAGRMFARRRSPSDRQGAHQASLREMQSIVDLKAFSI